MSSPRGVRHARPSPSDEVTRAEVPVADPGFLIRPRAIAVLAGAALVVTVAAGTVPGVHRMVVMSFTHQAATYTALAFADPQVGAACSSARTGHSIGFTIDNHQERDTTYSYQLDVRPRTGRPAVISGSVTVGAGVTSTERPALPGTPIGPGTQITVHLIGRTEQISLTCPAPAGAG